MGSKPSQEILVSFVDDAREQLASVRRSVKAYRQDKNSDALIEAIRSTHSIKGAASMIGLSPLGHIAYLLQEVLETVRDSELRLSGQTSRSVTQLVEATSSYVSKLIKGRLNQRALISKAVIAYRRFHDLPDDGDQAQIDQLISDSSPAPTSSDSKDSKTIGSRRQDDEFREEASDHIRCITTQLPNLRSNSENDDAVAQIQRHLHSLKGSASVIGQSDIADLSHLAEDLLSQISSNRIDSSDATIQLFSRAIDTLGDQIEETTGSSDEITKIMQQINELLDDTSTSLSSTSEDQPLEDPQPSSEEASSRAQDKLREEIRGQLGRRDAIAEDLLEVFTDEAEDHIKSIYAALSRESEDQQDESIIAEVRRSAHTLKGASGAVGLQIVTQLSHRMEDLLDRIYDESISATSEIISLLLATTDTLHDLCTGQFDRESMIDEIVELHARYASHMEPSANNSIEPLEPTLAIQPATVAKSEGSEESSPTSNSATTGSIKAETGQVLRVPIDRLDDLVRTASELIINRTSFEQRMAHFSQNVEELQLILERVRGISNEMDTRHSVDALRTGSTNPETDRFSEFDALEFDRYTNLHLVARSLSEATGDINTVAGELRTLIGDFDSLLDRQGRLARETQDRLMRVRMVPLATLATRLHRAVRVVATKQSKPVELLIDGQDIELDKTVLEEIADPLLHLLRNAVDHGVEPAAVRSVEGKPEKATIRIRAYHEGTQVVIKITDDGSGLDAESIRAGVVRDGLLSAGQAEAMNAEALFPYIFVPGFSTAAQISEVSGRGVGLDVVREKVQKLKGDVQVQSEAGQGTEFTIRLPMTLAVTRALIVTSANEDFAIPMQSVVQLVRLQRDEVQQLGAEPVVQIAGKAYPLISLADQLGLKQTSDSVSSSMPVLIMHSGDRQVAISVDKILAGRDIVIKTLGTHLRKVPGLIGATLMGDGTVVPILDPAHLVGTDSSTVGPAVDTGSPGVAAVASSNLNVMIVDDSVSVRRVMTNMIKSAGWIPTTAKDGVDALDTLRCLEHAPDAFLVDIEMPAMDGYELLSSLRSQPQFRETPVIMVTSRSGDKHREKAMSLGATDYVIKPFQDEQLVALIQRLVGGKDVVTV